MNAMAPISRISDGVEADFLHAVDDCAELVGSSGRSVGVRCTMMTSRRLAAVDHRKDRRIAHEAAVPIGVAVDLRCARIMNGRQAEASTVGAELFAGEHLHLAGADVGRRQKQLDQLFAVCAPA